MLQRLLWVLLPRYCETCGVRLTCREKRDNAVGQRAWCSEDI